MNEPENADRQESPHERALLTVLKDIRKGRDPKETLVAIVAKLIVASRNAATEAGSQLEFFPKVHHIGQNRYGFMQDAFFIIGTELGLPMAIKKHPGGSTSYAVLEHERLRITLASVPKYKVNPPLHPFRRGTAVASHRPWQLDLLKNTPPPDPNQLVVTLVFGFKDGDKVTPAFFEARFVSGDHYINDCVDVLALWKQAQVLRVEQVPATPQPPIRKKKNLGAES